MNAIPAAAPRSTFVNVVGWIFLVFSGLGVLVGILQNIMVHTVFPPGIFEQIASEPPSPGMPAITLWLFGNFKLLFALMLLMSTVHFVAALGLLRRWNWARLLFIGLMVLGIVSNLGGLAFQGVMMSHMHDTFSGLHQARPEHMPDLRWLLIGIGVFSVAMALAFSALYAWIIKRLLSAPVVAEFRG